MLLKPLPYGLSPLSPLSSPFAMPFATPPLVPLIPVLVPPTMFIPPPKTWLPRLTGTLRPTLVSFSPPSSTCIWVLCRSFDLPLDCSRLICDGGKPINVPTPPRNGEKRLPPIEVPPCMPWSPLSPIPPRAPSEGDWMVVLPTTLLLESRML